MKEDDPLQQFLADCYAFGDKVQDIDFKDAVADASFQRTRNVGKLSGHMTKTIYMHTQEGSPARKLCVDLLVRMGGGEIFKRREWMREVCSEDFLLDCIAALASRYRDDYREPPYERYNTCRYHEHAKTGSVCYKKKRGNGYKEYENHELQENRQTMKVVWN
jgi:hypothetical protein